MCGRTRVSAESIEYAEALAATANATSGSTPSTSASSASNTGTGNVSTSDTNIDSVTTEEYTFRPCENCIPGRTTPIVCACGKEGAKVLPARWGLIPSYTQPDAKLDFFRMNNARIENMARIHARLIKRSKRCVVVVAGFYEWKVMDTPTKGKMKQPFYLYMKNKKPLMFAGFYDMFYKSEEEKMRTYTVITMPVSESLKWLHHRMPAVLPNEEAATTWLTSSNWEECKKLLVSDNDSLTWHPVTPRMGKSTYQEPDCAKPIVLEKAKSIKNFIAASPKKTKTEDVKPEEEKQVAPISKAKDADRIVTEDGARDEERKRDNSSATTKTSEPSPSSTRKRKLTSPGDPKQRLLTGFFKKQAE